MIMLPICAIITTKNESHNIQACLDGLRDFSKIIVVDSHSHDQTAKIAAKHGADVSLFEWNGHYPKKRQWCLEHLTNQLQHPWIFFIDADERTTPEFIHSLKKIDWQDCPHDGFFIAARYCLNGQLLQHGLQNNKLALFRYNAFQYPQIDDLACPDMGEIEGHYQPILTRDGSIGHIRSTIIHEALDDINHWHQRHERYARWEYFMDQHHLWPAENHRLRHFTKALFRAMPFWLRGYSAFFHSYIIKAGFLDGANGLIFARLRLRYYKDDYRKAMQRGHS